MTAPEYIAAEIAAGRLRWEHLPQSLRVLVAAFDACEPGPDTFAAMTADQVEAFAVAVAVWQDRRGLLADGLPGPVTRAEFELARDFEGKYRELAPKWEGQRHFAPHSPELIALLEDACRVLGLDLRVARTKQTHRIIDEESAGWVGRPNYRIRLHGKRVSSPTSANKWPEVWAAVVNNPGSLRDEEGILSTACGLGQLTAPNMRRDALYGTADLGDPLGEAIAFIRYVLRRYRAPGVGDLQAFIDAWDFRALPAHDGPKSERPPGCVYGWEALARYGGPGVKPGEGY